MSSLSQALRLEDCRLRRRNYSRPLASELDVQVSPFRDCLSSLFWLEKVRRLKDRGEKFVLSIDLSVFLQSTYASAYHI